MSPPSCYRPDLDGLRAIAVVSVILFHLEIPCAPGGFVGVDVFFVLSGYFITRQIALELAENRFSLLNFYDRRIRRLFPALFAMLLATTLAAMLFLMPDDLEQFGSTLAAAALSFSNFVFWNRADYFAPDAETMPLLHTWSLAVEEQFYLVFPLLLMLIWRCGRTRTLATLVGVCLASLILSVWGTRTFPEATFYLLPTRAWELLLGSLLALAPGWGPKSTQLRNIFVVVGLAGIAVAITTYDTTLPFPGLAAGLPCVGAALVIAAGQPRPGAAGAECSTVCLASRLLALSPLVFIGLISYSLYLWHWPMIVFVHYASIDPLTGAQTAMLMIAIFLIAYLSWRFIEQPFRRDGSGWTTRSKRFSYCIASTAAFGALGVGIEAGKGFPWLSSAEVLVVLQEAKKDVNPDRKKCHIGPQQQGEIDIADTCVVGPDDGKRIIVFSDSHGAEISYALSMVAAERGLQVRQLSASGCPPALMASPKNRPRCQEHIERVVKGLGQWPRSTLMLTAYYFDWAKNNDAEAEAFWHGFESVVNRLKMAGHDVVLLGGVPPHPFGSLATALAKQVKYGRDPEDYVFPIPGLANTIDTRLSRIASDQSAIYVPLLPSVCRGTHTCRAYLDRRSIYFDSNHLTVTTAHHLVQDVILPAIANTGQTMMGQGKHSTSR